MVRIEFLINGRKVSPENVGRAFADAVEGAMLQAVSDNIRHSLLDVRCPEHGQAPRVTGTGRSIQDLSFTVEGCCQKLIDAATRALNI